ncbi:MAG: DUF6798 domain-containing protein [Pirellula sp.]
MKTTPRRSWSDGFLADWLGVFLVFFLYAGGLVPGVNEPHYWTKAAHFWNPSLGRGDLFLESGNAHWLFYATWGALTQCLPLPWAVWVARLGMWGLLAAGWTWMMRGVLRDSASMRDSSATASEGRSESGGSNGNGRWPWIGTLTAAAWLAAMHWGHWSGEWVVGGAESKVVAYAAVFFAFGCFFRGQWVLGWWALGGASAFHVVTGIWATLGALVITGYEAVSRGNPHGESTVSSGVSGRLATGSNAWWRQHRWGLLGITVGLAVGVIPPLWSDWNATSEQVSAAAATQVYRRLGHHLAPSKISMTRWISFGVLLVFGAVVLAMLWRAAKSRDGDPESDAPSRVGWNAWPFGLRWSCSQAVFALGVAAIGLVLDYGIGSVDRELAAKVLKVYWFRWNDVLWPMATAAGLAALAYGTLEYRPSPKGARWMALGVLLSSGALVVFARTLENRSEWIPFGDRASFLAKGYDESQQKAHFQDWLAVCAWVRDQTDPAGLWLTPRNQQSFKWHTLRAELVAWKDMPQDAISVVEWAKRLDDAYRYNEDKQLQPWTDAQLWSLHEKYGIRYVLVDRRVAGQMPPLLPMIYPTAGSANETFFVFEFPKGEAIDPKMQLRRDASSAQEPSAGTMESQHP